MAVWENVIIFKVLKYFSRCTNIIYRVNFLKYKCIYNHHLYFYCSSIVTRFVIIISIAFNNFCIFMLLLSLSLIIFLLLIIYNSTIILVFLLSIWSL